MATTRFLLGRRGRHLYPLRRPTTTTTLASTASLTTVGIGSSSSTATTTSSSAAATLTATTATATTTTTTGRHSVPAPRRNRSWNFKQCHKRNQPAYAYGFPIPPFPSSQSSSSSISWVTSPIVLVTLVLLSGCFLGAYCLVLRIDNSLQQQHPTTIPDVQQSKYSLVESSSTAFSNAPAVVRLAPEPESSSVTDTTAFTSGSNRHHQSPWNQQQPPAENLLVPFFLNVTLFQIPCEDLTVQIGESSFEKTTITDRLIFKTIVLGEPTHQVYPQPPPTQRQQQYDRNPQQPALDDINDSEEQREQQQDLSNMNQPNQQDNEHEHDDDQVVAAEPNTQNIRGLRRVHVGSGNHTSTGTTLLEQEDPSVVVTTIEDNNNQDSATSNVRRRRLEDEEAKEADDDDATENNGGSVTTTTTSGVEQEPPQEKDPNKQSLEEEEEEEEEKVDSVDKNPNNNENVHQDGNDIQLHRVPGSEDEEEEETSGETHHQGANWNKINNEINQDSDEKQSNENMETGAEQDGFVAARINRYPNNNNNNNNNNQISTGYSNQQRVNRLDLNKGDEAADEDKSEEEKEVPVVPQHQNNVYSQHREAVGGQVQHHGDNEEEEGEEEELRVHGTMTTGSHYNHALSSAAQRKALPLKRGPTNGCQVMGHLKLSLDHEQHIPTIVSIRATSTSSSSSASTSQADYSDATSSVVNLSHRVDKLKLGWKAKSFPMEETFVINKFIPQTYTAEAPETLVVHKYKVYDSYQLIMSEAPTGASPSGTTPEIRFVLTPSLSLISQR